MDADNPDRLGNATGKTWNNHNISHLIENVATHKSHVVQHLGLAPTADNSASVLELSEKWRRICLRTHSFVKLLHTATISSAINRLFTECGNRYIMASDDFPSRPARPACCQNVSKSLGGPHIITFLTSGISTPIPKATVATTTRRLLWFTKLSKIRSWSAGCASPWYKSTSLVLADRSSEA